MGSTTGIALAADFGLIGLGVMGENLALNVEAHGFRVAMWNHTPRPISPKSAASAMSVVEPSAYSLHL